MTYRVSLPVFEGPFDLLLHLIAKRELDIYEVSLAAIVEDYLAHLRDLAELDLEVATEFLVVAATLIEIKAARLLPGPPADDEEALAVSERDLLIARLLEYRAFKDAAGHIAALMEENAGYLARSAGPGEELANLCPDLLARVGPQRLRELALRALSPAPPPVLDTAHITPIRASVTEAIEEVSGVLRDRSHVSFRELTASCRSRIEVIVRFLAVLELVKAGRADVAQARTFGEIVVARLEEEPGPRRPLVVDEYEGTPETEIALEPEGSGDEVIVLEEESPVGEER